MPVDEFLDEFFPNPPELDINCDEISFASIPDSPAREEEMYEGLVSAKSLVLICYLSDQPQCNDLNKIAEPCDFFFADTSNTGCIEGYSGSENCIRNPYKRTNMKCIFLHLNP